jgi:hypothetical protein
MKLNSFLPYILIFFIALASRLPLLEQFQSHWDGADYAIAVVSYSLENYTPTAPGYPLYIASAKLINIIVNDPHTSLLLLSALITSIGALAFIFVGKRIFNIKTGIIASLIYLTGSTFYYFSLTPYGYVYLPLLNILLAYSVYLSFIKKKDVGLFLGIIVGLFFGVRPQEMIQVGFLALLGFIFLRNKQKVIFIFTFVVITCAWLIPLVIDSGGIKNYININLNSANQGFFLYSLDRSLIVMLKGFLLSFGIASIFILYYGLKVFKNISIISKHKKIIFFFAVWAVPSILFNLFVRTDHAGYQMTYLTSFLILISYGLYRTVRNNNLFVLVVALTCIFNLYWFFYDRDPKFEKPFRPTSFHYSDIRKNDIIIGSKINYVKNNFNPENTLLISTEVAWRQYAYYLKDFHIVALNAFDNKKPPYIYGKFEGHNWITKRKDQINFTYKIPENINRIIFMDTAMNDWIDGNNYKVINLPGNGRITFMDVNNKSKMLYDYRFIKIID